MYTCTIWISVFVRLKYSDWTKCHIWISLGNEKLPDYLWIALTSYWMNCLSCSFFSSISVSLLKSPNLFWLVRTLHFIFNICAVFKQVILNWSINKYIYICIPLVTECVIQNTNWTSLPKVFIYGAHRWSYVSAKSKKTSCAAPSHCSSCSLLKLQS